MPCPYANILGEPGKGFHAWRVGGLAVWDVIGTILIAGAMSYYFGWTLLYTLIGLFVAGEVAHWVFGTRTAVLVALGLTRSC
jgi:hypothetical protein